MSQESKSECNLCGDVDAVLFLHARCHPSAPLRAVKDGECLILRCYLPACDREVVRLELASAEQGAALARVTAERDKWLKAFNDSEQFQNRPTVRAAMYESQLAIVKQERDEARGQFAQAVHRLEAEVEQLKAGREPD